MIHLGRLTLSPWLTASVVLHHVGNQAKTSISGEVILPTNPFNSTLLKGSVLCKFPNRLKQTSCTTKFLLTSSSTHQFVTLPQIHMELQSNLRQIPIGAPPSCQFCSAKLTLPPVRPIYAGLSARFPNSPQVSRARVCFRLRLRRLSAKTLRERASGQRCRSAGQRVTALATTPPKSKEPTVMAHSIRHTGTEEGLPHPEKKMRLVRCGMAATTCSGCFTGNPPTTKDKAWFVWVHCEEMPLQKEEWKVEVGDTPLRTSMEPLELVSVWGGAIEICRVCVESLKTRVIKSALYPRGETLVHSFHFPFPSSPQEEVEP